MLQNCILFLLFLCITTSAASQSKYSYYQYNADNGMPSNGIRGMFFDSTTGFLWLATEAGLTRFNGTQFMTFTEGKHRQVLTDRMVFLFQNTDGYIYAADQLSRLYRIQKQTPFFFDSITTSPTLLESAYLLNVSDKMYGQRKKITNKTLLNPLFDFDKTIPLSDTTGLVIHEKDNRLYYISLKNPDPYLLTLQVKSIRNGFITDSRCFIADDRYIYEFKPSDSSLKKMGLGFSSLRSDLIFWQNGSKEPIYISGNKAFTLRAEKEMIYRDIICDSLPEEGIIKFAQYNRAIKTLFLGKESSGIIIIKEKSVETIKAAKNSRIKAEAFYGQIVLPNGNILTSDGQQLGKKPMTESTPIKGSYGRFSFREGDSVIWYAKEIITAKGANEVLLHSYNFRTNKTVVFQKIELGFQSPLQKSGGNLYAFTPRGLYMLQEDSLISVDKRFDEDIVGMPFDLKEISPGVLSIVSSNYVFLYDIYTCKTDTILVNKGVGTRAIWSYDDYTFISTYGAGIYVYHNGITKPLPLDKNRHLLFAHCFVKDEYGYCWISSNKGLFKARISDMINAFESDNTENAIVYYHYYGKADGMAITEMNGGCVPCAVERQDKTISFPTMSGLLWVDPSIANPGLPWSNLYIDAFFANGVRINPDSLQYKYLPSNTKDIRLKISYPVWENPENIYIQYRFTNDSTWKWLEPEGNIVLSNPGYDEHTLQIRKSNGFGTKNITVMNFRFTIARPIYITWWFYTLLGGCVLGLIYMYMRLRTRQYTIHQHKLENIMAEKTRELTQQNIELEKRDAIKTRLISIISHDIITPLKFLAVTGKNLMEKRKMMNEKIQDETISEMVNTSKELQSLSTNILNWIKYQSEGKGLIKDGFLLYQMVNELLKVLNPVANLKQLQIINNINPQLEVYQYYDPLKVLVYNLVSNSIKFTQEGSVIIDAEATDKQVTIRVSDQGIGMTGTQVNNLLIGKTHIHSIKNNPGTGHGLGYQIIRDLLNITEATIAIESEQGKGTTVLIKFVYELPEYPKHLSDNSEEE